MPRHTHPRPRRKHGRDHIRFQRDRWATIRWGQAVGRYGTADWDRAAPHPEDVRRDPGAHPFSWPFTLPRNAFTRNPFNRCSCWMCSPTRAERRKQRRADTARWRADVRRDLEEA
ncbi:MAG: hypothetical protein M0P31_10885 [Solirubrobacteraceae bacterium]|nr:hypothetical protein [Solirubrobacteraceae bacterium]